MLQSKVYVHAEVRQPERRVEQSHSALPKMVSRVWISDEAGIAFKRAAGFMEYLSLRRVGYDLDTRTPTGKGPN